MALAITTEQEQLADAVTKFAARHAPADKTRTAFESIAAGELPCWWQEFSANGFNAVHIPEEAGGQGGTLADMARAMPKSVTLTRPSFVTRMFCGFTSQWTNPARCAAPNAAQA